MAGKVNLTCILACVLLMASCGGGAALDTHGVNPSKSIAAAFSAEFLPGGLIGDAVAGDIALEIADDATGKTVTVSLAGASNLTAILLDINYDPAHFTPLTAECTAGLGDPDSCLELVNLTDPGCVHLGRILTHPTEHNGFTGSAPVAVVTFANTAFTGNRNASRAPYGEASAALLSDTAAGEITWYHTSLGDYDQNGLVSAADLVPVALYYGESVAPDLFEMDDVRSIVDGSNDGVIGVADITPIGQSFNNSILGGFNIYFSEEAADYPETSTSSNGDGSRLLGHVGLEETITENPSEHRKQYSFAVTQPDATGYYWLRARDEFGNEGIASEVLTELGVRVPRIDEAMAQARLDSGSSIVLWYYYNPGDTNLDGIVDINDISAIGDDLSRLGPFHPDTLTGIKDVNHDQVINETDINLIQGYYGNTIVGYNVYASSNPVDYPATNGYPSANNPVGKVTLSNRLETSGRPCFAYPTVNPLLYHWVRPYDALGNEGTPSELQYPLDPEKYAPSNTTSAAVASWDEQTGYMWYYFNAGDYNQNCMVEVGDLTIIGQHFGSTGPFEFGTIQDIVDGNRDDFIDDKDVGLVQKYNSNYIAGYNLYTSNDPTDYTFSSTSPSRTGAAAQINFSEALGDRSTERLYFEYLPPPGAIQYYMWVRPYDLDGNEGVPSNLVVVE